VATAALATLAAVLACVLLASPAAAQCGGKPIPPGNSEVDQYQEAIPGNCGETEPNKNGNGGGSVPSGTSDDLEALGEDGAAVADLVTSTGSGADGSGNGKDGEQASGAGAAAAAQADTGSAVSAAVRGLAGDSDDGLGAALPVLLVALLAAALAVVAIRRSRA
jgi:hypothetical protein